MKILIICPGFQRSNIRKQPWRYIYEIARYFQKDNEVTLITDNSEKFPEFNIINIKKLFIPLNGESKELLDVINEISPDRCIMLMGLSSFLRIGYKINQPVIGVFTSPLYSIGELIRTVGLRDLIEYRRYTFIHIVNSLIPSYFIRKWSHCFEKMVFLSQDTEKKMIKKGFPKEKSVFIPCGIDSEFLNKPEISAIEKIKTKLSPEETPILMYFTSPLTLRGTDTLIKAFANVEKIKDCKLVFLSRIDYNDSFKEQEKLKKLAQKKNVLEKVEFLSDYLEPDEIKLYLSAADIICLPFKIILSDVPISILEAMALGKVVISSKVACIPEIIHNSQLIVDNPEELSEQILELLSEDNLISDLGTQNSLYMDNYPSWNEISKRLLNLIR